MQRPLRLLCVAILPQCTQRKHAHPRTPTAGHGLADHPAAPRAMRHAGLDSRWRSRAGFLINGPFNDAFVEGLGDCVNQGLAQAVGVSNFTADRVRRSSSILQVARRTHPSLLQAV